MPELFAQICPHDLFFTSSEVELHNGDPCQLGQHVIIQRSPQEGQAPFPPFIARVHEILHHIGSVDYHRNCPDGVLVQTLAHVHPGSTCSLLMPQLVLQDEWSFVRLSEVLCTVNTPHNCCKYQCPTTGIRHVYQERVQTTQTNPAVEHVSNPDDLILNIAQMRDATYLQQFRIPPIPLDPSKIIQESAACAIDQRRFVEAGGTRGRGARARAWNNWKRERTNNKHRKGSGQGAWPRSACGGSLLKFTSLQDISSLLFLSII